MMPEIPSSQPAPAEDLKKHYVKRLERLIRLRSDFENDLNRLGLDLLDKSIQATYQDCLANGADQPASALMARMRSNR